MSAAKQDRGNKARISKNNWVAIVKSVANKHGLPEAELFGKKKTIYARIGRGNLSGGRMKSPVAEMEPILVEMVIMKERLRQPITAKEGKQFANSLLEKSSMQEQLKTVHSRCGRASALVGELGSAWWNMVS